MRTPYDELAIEGLHARDMVEMAGLVALRAGPLIAASALLPEKNLHDYWIRSRSRFDCWSLALKRFASPPSPKRRRPRAAVRSVIEEIFVSEALTRVWTAVLAAHDEAHRCDTSRPVAMRVFQSHAEVRHRALDLMRETRIVRSADARGLVRLHCRISRWVDLLVAHLTRKYRVSRYAFDPQRCLDFASDLVHEHRIIDQQAHTQLTLAALQNALSHDLTPVSPNAELNFKIAANIILCFSLSDFEATGALRWLWRYRLVDSAADCDRMIAQLLASD